MGGFAKIAASLVALTCLWLPAQAQNVDGAKPAKKPLISREIPKDPSLLDKFNMTTTDSGRSVRQRLELDLSPDKNIFIYGNKTTAYPTGRNPGQEFQPVIPQTQPKDTYSIGIGQRF